MNGKSFWRGLNGTRVRKTMEACDGSECNRRPASGRRSWGWMTCVLPIVCALLLAILTTPAIMAQIATGGVTGTVKDSAGAVVSDAQVALTNTETGVAQTTRSTSTGTYVFNAVPVGHYTLRVQHPGFQDYLVSGFDVHIQVVLTEDATLTVGTMQQQVTVQSTAPLLQAESASVGTTIEGKSIVDLPLNGRDWASLAQLGAGVTIANQQFSGSATNSASGSAYYMINGMDPWEVDFRLNGINDNVELYGGPGPTNTNVNVTPPPDAISEFRLQTGDYSAEFGHSTGGVINAVVKSGTNHFHGALWEFLRNDAFDANDYFSKQYGIPIPEYRQNQFGGTIGGPVLIPKLYNGRNKTFFFFDYQGTRIIQPTSYTNSVPTKLEQSSDFTNFQDLIAAGGSATKTDALGRVFPYGAILDPATTRSVPAGGVDPVSLLPNTSGSTIYVRDPFFTGGSMAGITNFTSLGADLNQIPASRLDPNAVKLMQLYPAPTSGGVANNYFLNGRTPTNINQYDVRIDENWGGHDTIFGVFDKSKYTINQPNKLPGIADGGQFGTGTITIPAYSIALGETHVFSPTLTNDFHAGWNHNVQSQLSSNATDMGIPAQFGIQGVPQVPDNGGLPSFGISGLTNLGPSPYMPTTGTITTLELMDNVSKQKGSHDLKWGFQFDRFYGIVFQPPYGRGQFTYSGQYSDVINHNTNQLGMVDLLLTPTATTVPNGISDLGSMSNFQASNIAPNRDIRYYYGAYFQDNWKATPNLTLNLGLRWDHFTPYKEINGRQANFIQSGAGNGDTGTLYIPNEGCQVPRAPAFDALLTSSNISLVCTSNKATGNAQNLNFAPRVGFAERIKDNWVLRGGYGIAYGALANIGFGPNIGNNYPFAYVNSFNSPNAYQPFTNNPGGATPVMETVLTTFNVDNPALVTPVGLNLNGRQYDMQTPYSQTFNLTTQYQFTHSDSIQVGYVGVLGRHLNNVGVHNSPSEILPVGTNTADYVPFPSFNYNSNYQSSNGKSSYNSMQVTYQHQTSFGLNLLANYTYSKCFTNAAYYASMVQSYRAQWLPGFGINGDYTLCDTDTTNVVHVSGQYDLPIGRGAMYLKNINRVADAFIGGWSVNYIYTFQSGNPFPIYCAQATTADFGCYANIVDMKHLYTGGRTQHQWLNPAALATPPQATAIGQTDYAPLGGNPLVARGPHYNNLDFSVFKSFGITKETSLQFRAEAFNLTNTPQFGQPNNTGGYTNPGPDNLNGFSEIFSLRNNPRLLQFALKLYY